MAVIYLFNAAKELRRPVREGVQEIIHSEGEYTAVTQILAKDAPEYGDYFGFKCMDGRFRLFLINTVEINDAAGTCMLTGTDAAIAELENSVVTYLYMQNTTAAKAVSAALQGTGWAIGNQTGDGEINIASAYFATRWTAIKNAAAAGGVRAIPYYEFSGNQITAKKVDLLDKTPVFSGLIYTRKRGAQNIHITREGIPYGRVFPVGKIIGSEEPPEQVTIAEAVWSKANGDPVDKPAGQLWIALPDAISDAEYVFEDKKEEDPNRLMEKAFADLEKTSRPTASGTANISEMERIPGYEHMIAQMWMMAVVRSEYGESVETTITNIERYYVHTELTKITVGDEDSNADMLENLLASMQNSLLDVEKVAGGGRAGAGKAEKMVLEATELIQLNSRRIEANADEIRLRATTARVDQLEDLTFVEFQEVYLDIDTNRALISATDQRVDNINNEVTGIAAELTVQAGEIKQRAYQYYVDELGNRVETAESTLLVQASQIAGKVSQYDFDALGNRVTTAESTLLVQANQIAGKVSQYDFDALGNRVTTAESELIVQAGQIGAKVGKDGVIGAINLTPENTLIQSNRINLVGYVTASMFEAEIAAIQNVFAGNSIIGGLGVSGQIMTTNLDVASNMRLFGSYTQWKTLTMGNITGAAYLGRQSDAAMNLQHSHNVVVNADGTITLAEVSSSGGSFKIADTKAYKDGVSAAEGRGYNNGYEAGKTAYSPTLITRTSYSTTSKNVTVKAANSYQDLLTGIVIDASEIHTAGYNEGWSKGYDAGYAAAGSYDSGYADGYNAAKNNVTVGQSSFTITNTARNTFFASARIWAKIDGETVASGTITKTQTINVGQ